MRIFKTILLALLSALAGGLFLYSAYTKLLPIQTFEYTLVEFVQMPWWMAAVASRLLVGIEAALGALLVFNIFGSGKWVLKLSLAILFMFSIYLIYLWATAGNDVNCGCFGDVIWMSPSSSLIKNAVTIIALLLLLKLHSGITAIWAKYTALAVVVVVTILPLFIYPVTSKPSFLNKDKYELDLSAIYQDEENAPPAVDVRKGKHIIAFMSLTCPHCKIAAHKMQLMKRSNPNISMLLVLNGDSTDLKSFWEKTKARDIPHTMLYGKDFVSLSGLNLPAIYWINDSWVEAKTNYIDLNQAAIEDWLTSGK
jgi:hypothetical protein